MQKIKLSPTLVFRTCLLSGIIMQRRVHYIHQSQFLTDFGTNNYILQYSLDEVVGENPTILFTFGGDFCPGIWFWVLKVCVRLLWKKIVRQLTLSPTRSFLAHSMYIYKDQLYFKFVLLRSITALIQLFSKPVMAFNKDLCSLTKLIFVKT